MDCFYKTNHQSNLYRSCLWSGKRLVFVKPTVIPTTCIKIRRLERGWSSQNQPSFQPWALRYEGWKGVGFRKSNCRSDRCRSWMRVEKWLVFVKPSVIPTTCIKIRRLEPGWFSQNQPSLQPWTSRYEGWIGVDFHKTTLNPSVAAHVWELESGWFSSFQPCALNYEGWNGVCFRKTNRHSNHGLYDAKVGMGLVFVNPTVDPTVAAPEWGLENGWFLQNQPSTNLYRSCLWVGKRLVFVKPTVIPTTCIKIRRLERGWFSQNQPSLQPWASRYEGWNGVGFHKTNPQSIRCRSCMRVGKRLVFVNPTIIPTMCFKIRSLERGWFTQNQPSFQPWAMIYEGWNGVGFRKTYCQSNRCRSCMRVGNGLVFANPTVIPTMCFKIRRWTRLVFAKPNVIRTFGIPVWWLEIGWFRVDYLHKATKHGWTSPRGYRYATFMYTPETQQKFRSVCNSKDFLLFPGPSKILNVENYK